MPTLNIFGTGGFGRELLGPALAALETQRRTATTIFDEVAFLDDSRQASQLLGHSIRHLDQVDQGDVFVIAIGDGVVRSKVEERCLQRGMRPFSLTAPTAVIGVDTDIDNGSVFCDFTMVTASAVIGKQFQCNIYSYVAHDCIIGDYVTFAPRVSCNGNVRIGDFAYIGTGAVIKQGTPDKPLIIGRGAIVGMGAVVTKDVPPGAVVIGNPAREKAAN